MKENPTVIIFEDEDIIFARNNPFFFAPEILVKQGEKWIKHVVCDSARFHVLNYSLPNGIRCSEPNCIYNKPKEK